MQVGVLSIIPQIHKGDSRFSNTIYIKEWKVGSPNISGYTLQIFMLAKGFNITEVTLYSYVHNIIDHVSKKPTAVASVQLVCIPMLTCS